MHEACEICGSTRGLDRHHVLHKKIGGSRDPAVHDHANLISICRPCHMNLHEGIWRLERLADGIRIVDHRTGRQVMRRLRDADVDVPTLLHGLTLAESTLAHLVDALPYLSDDQLVEAFASTVELGRRAWLVQAAILYEAQQRSVYGDRTLEAVARRFEISPRQAEKYALVWRTSEPGAPLKNVNVDEIVLDEPSWYVVAASESPEPATWLAYAQDRKLEDPRYSVAAFRRDIQAARRSGEGLVGNASIRADDFDSRPSWHCPWVRPYCTRGGTPVPVEDCRDCDVAAHSAACQPSSEGMES
jgi:hypothetical protein